MKEVLLFFILLTLVSGFLGVFMRLDILIEQTQTWEEYCTENPFECAELM